MATKKPAQAALIRKLAAKKVPVEKTGAFNSPHPVHTCAQSHELQTHYRLPAGLNRRDP